MNSGQQDDEPYLGLFNWDQHISLYLDTIG